MERSGFHQDAARLPRFAYDCNGYPPLRLGTLSGALDAQGVAAASNTVQDYWYRYHFHETAWSRPRARARAL